MRHIHPFTKALVLAAVIPTPLLLLIAVETTAQTVLPLGSFRSVTLRNGGVVTLRHATKQRVTLLKGTASCTWATIVDGDRLVIDRNHRDCSNRQRLEVEVFTPDLEGITVMDGGIIRTRGGFPRQEEIQVAVEDGGTIDLRSMTVKRVTAAVRSGGRILTKPQEALVAKVARGGAVTYWGNPRVTRSVEHAGVVSRGAAADADKPLIELDPATCDAPPLPALPPLPPSRDHGVF